MSNIFQEKLWRQIVIDAPFEAYLREDAASNPIFSLMDLAEKDQSLENFFRLLEIGVSRGNSLKGSIKLDDWGAVFTTAVLGLRLQRDDLLELAFEGIDNTLSTADELFNAIKWQSPSDKHLRQIIQHQNPYVKQAAIAAFPSNPSDIALDKWLAHDEMPVALKMLDYVGQKRLSNRQKHVSSYYDSTHDELRFRAAVNGLLINDSEALSVIKTFTDHDNPRLRQALQWLFIFGDERQIPQWLDSVTKMNVSPRVQSLSIAYSGQTEHVRRLFTYMEDPHYAQVAAEAFSMLTGTSLVDENLDDVSAFVDEPTAAQKRLTDPQYRDYEEELPWPNVEALLHHWLNNRDKFKPNTRYLAGHESNDENLKEILRNGQQNQRYSASLILAKMNQTKPVFPVRNKFDIQRMLLDSL